MLFLLLFLVLFGESTAAVPAKYDVGVEGQLKCAEYPAATVRIRLWKNNEKSVLNETYADKSGHFSLTATVGTADFDPIIVIYHDCDDGVKPGQRKLKFQVPRHYITFGPDRKRPFQLGSFNLETVMKYNEERQQYVDKRRRRRKDIHKSPRTDDLRKLEREWEEKNDTHHAKRKHRTRRCDDCEIEEVDVDKHHHSSTTTTTNKPKKNLFDSEPDDRYDPW